MLAARHRPLVLVINPSPIALVICPDNEMARDREGEPIYIPRIEASRPDILISTPTSGTTVSSEIEDISDTAGTNQPL